MSNESDRVQENPHPAEHSPLFNKLEGRQTQVSPWHNEGLEYSRTGRKMINMLLDALKSIFS